jgi:LacI family transcriptional regulator
MMRVTIYDLAREAGVGIGTVSRCLNNHPNVSASTRARVLDTARRLSYEPHAHAKGLASRRTNTIAAIIPYFTNYFFQQVLQGIQDTAGASGFDLILYGVNHPEQVQHYLHRSLQRGRVDGVMFFSMNIPDSYAEKFRQMRLPLVLVDGSHPDFDSIRVENREGALAAVRHLIRLGHRDVALINASMETRPARERYEGYVRAHEEAGIEFSRERVFISDVRWQDGFTREAGREAMHRLLARRRAGDRITAVLVASDIQAFGALEVARESHVAVPDDLAMVGFDDIELAQYLQLTTMRQPMYEMGVLAMERLASRIRTPDLAPALTTFVPELVVRGTCGATASRMAFDSPLAGAEENLQRQFPASNAGVTR